MKRKKILVVILAICLFFVTGCGNLNTNLKLEKTEKSVANFYYAFMDDALYMDELIKQKNSEGEQSDNEYNMLSFITLSMKEYGYSIISAMDYCINSAESSGQSTIDQGIYEYHTNYAEFKSTTSKLIVVVNKVAGKNNVFTSSLYFANPNQSFSELQERGESANMEHSYTISRNRTEGTYEFSDATNGINGSFAYNKENGHMSLLLSYKYEMLNNQSFTTQIDLYNYTNNTLGFRMTTSTTMENSKVLCIYEFISKPFIKNAKMGYIRNSQDYYDMTNCQESQIGVANVGDKSGYTIKYQNTSDTTPANVLVNKYGLTG